MPSRIECCVNMTSTLSSCRWIYMWSQFINRIMLGDDETGAKKLRFECLWYQALIRDPTENGTLEAGNWWAAQYHITTGRPAGMREGSAYCKSEGESCCRRSHSRDAVTISQDSQHGMELEEATIQPHSLLSLLPLRISLSASFPSSFPSLAFPLLFPLGISLKLCSGEGLPLFPEPRCCWLQLVQMLSQSPQGIIRSN